MTENKRLKRERNTTPKIILFSYGPFCSGALIEVLKQYRLTSIIVPSKGVFENIKYARRMANAYDVSCFDYPEKEENLPNRDVFSALDLGIVYSFTHILPEKILDLPKHGFINVHPGLLPEYRGPHPIGWAVANKEKVTGVTIHKVTSVYDGGPIIARDEVLILPKESVLDVRQKLMHLAEELLEDTLSTIFDGTAKYIEQNEAKAKTYPRREGDY